ncbi:hypothetical protein HY971_01860 [Candidatus Kaiserbacteria bacterium]|nr:hypothetical protein [Candidatus Kaiserbacteria bacterium]
MTDVKTTKTTETEHVTTTHTHGEPKESLISNTLGIVGFIIVVAIVLWGLLHIASLGQPWLSSLFDTVSSKVNAPAKVESRPLGTLVMKPLATTTPVAPARSPVVGPTDLSVQILSVEPDGAGGGVATFDIGNEGQSSTGAYSFTAQLPTADGYLYNSPVQSSLAPGDHIVNTLRFSSAISGVFSVVVDTSKNESNTSNNYASRQVSMPYVNYNYNYNPQPYPQYQYGQYQYGF